MNPSALFAIKFVAGLHFAFALMEVLLWTWAVQKLKIYDKDQAEKTTAVGRNMGVYNGILGASLLWLAITPGLDQVAATSLATLLLVSATVAGIFGGATIKWTIPIFQSLPALVALALVKGWISCGG